MKMADVASFRRDFPVLFFALAVSLQTSLAVAQNPPSPPPPSPASPKADVQPKSEFQALLEQVRALLQARQFEDAIPAIKRMIELQPDSIMARVELSNALLNLRRTQEALTEANQAVKIDPKSALAHYGLGNVNFALRRYAEAVEAYSQATQLDPNYLRAYVSLGTLHGQTGKFAESEKAFKEALRIKPDDANSLNGLGIALFRQGRQEEGIALVQQAVSISPNFANAYINLGNWLSQLGRYEESVEAISQVIRIAPKFPTAYTNRALNNFYLGRSDAAAKDAKAFLDLTNWKGENAQFMVILAVLGYRKAGLEAEAQILIDQAPKRLDVMAWPFPVIRYLNRESTAQAILDLATNNDRMTEARAYLGIDLLQQGKREEALPHLQWVKENGNKRFVEYPLALVELGRLEKSAQK